MTISLIGHRYIYRRARVACHLLKAYLKSFYQANRNVNIEVHTGWSINTTLFTSLAKQQSFKYEFEQLMKRHEVNNVVI